MITPYVPLVLKENLEKVGKPDTKKVSGTNLCRHDLAESAKSADFWLSGRHVAGMSTTFPAKPDNNNNTTIKQWTKGLGLKWPGGVVWAAVRTSPFYDVVVITKHGEKMGLLGGAGFAWL